MPTPVVSGRFALARVVVLVVTAAGIALALLHPHVGVHVPYWRTATCVVLGGALILFGRRMRRAPSSVATRKRHPAGSALSGRI
ncbi:hypothetical protein ACFV9W_01685 [Streptomyces sp. NPDC059897]|uniref:hypothetical protein n=1 Tax=Streptomyces sp. NPDC059897 TaxID=3346994 RepID=UPI00365D8A5F